MIRRVNLFSCLCFWLYCLSFFLLLGSISSVNMTHYIDIYRDTVPACYIYISIFNRWTKFDRKTIRHKRKLNHIYDYTTHSEYKQTIENRKGNWNMRRKLRKCQILDIVMAGHSNSKYYINRMEKLIYVVMFIRNVDFDVNETRKFIGFDG